jgi:hypothetical protein
MSSCTTAAWPFPDAVRNASSLKSVRICAVLDEKLHDSGVTIARCPSQFDSLWMDSPVA